MTTAITRGAQLSMSSEAALVMVFQRFLLSFTEWEPQITASPTTHVIHFQIACRGDEKIVSVSTADWRRDPQSRALEVLDELLLWSGARASPA